jgi:S1-C subfamily serine protease
VLEGAYVTELSDQSAAKDAGIEVGDVVTAINDVKITSGSNLQEQILQYQVGEKIKVKVDRYGTAKEFTVELRNMQGNKEITKGVKSAEILGASFKTLSDKEKNDFRISYGIAVNNITRGGKIRECGIQNGFIIMMVNDQRMNTPEDFYSIVDKILKGNTEEKGLFIRGFYPNTGATRHYSIDLID